MVKLYSKALGLKPSQLSTFEPIPEPESVPNQYEGLSNYESMQLLNEQ